MQTMSISRARVISGGLALGLVPVVLAWIVLQPGNTRPKKRHHRAQNSLAQVEKRLKAPPVPRPSQEAPPSEPEQRPNPRRERQERRDLPLPDDWLGMRDEIQGTLAFELSPPGVNASRQAVRHYFRRTRERRKLLRAYESELVDFIEHELDPYVRLDAELTLAEVYLEQADVFDRTWIPERWTDAQANRRIRQLETRAAVARDKARMVTGIAQTEAAPLELASNDPLIDRLTDLAHGG